MICPECGDRFGWMAGEKCLPLDSDEETICIPCHQIKVGYYSTCGDPDCRDCNRKLELMKERGIVAPNEINGQQMC